MQLPSIESGRQAARRTTTERSTVARTTAVARVDESRQQTNNLLTPVTRPVRGGLKSVDAQLNRHVASAQQTLEYLDRAGSQLQNLRTALVARLTQRPDETSGQSAAAVDVEKQL